MKVKQLVPVLVLSVAAFGCKVYVDAVDPVPSEGDLGCKTNAECIDANGGRPFICNKVTRTCASLQVDLAAGGGQPAPCTLHAEPADLRNDETIWVGAIIDTTSPGGTTAGRDYVNFAELARQEIARKTGGLPPATPSGMTRPLAFVHCESNNDPAAALKAASYLVDQVGLQLFIAGERAATVVPMEQQVFLPKKVLNFSPIAGGIADIPSGNPPLHFALDSDRSTSLAAYPSQIAAIETDLRARIGRPPQDPIKLFLLSSDDPLDQHVRDQLVSTVKVNGKSLVDNGGNVTSIVYSRSATAAELDAVTRTAIAFGPDVVVAVGAELVDVILPAVDKGLATKGLSPSYHLSLPALGANIFTEATVRPDLQGRLFVSGPKYFSLEVQLKALDYAAAFPNAWHIDPVIQGFTAIAYDSVYLLAYAVVANGSAPLTGENVSKQLHKLFTKGATEVTASPADLFKGFQSFAPGQPGTIFLRGNQAFRGGEDRVELDLTTGKHSYWPVTLLCPLSNEAAGGPMPAMPPFAMLSLQPTGVESSYPGYSASNLTISPGCHKY